MPNASAKNGQVSSRTRPRHEEQPERDGRVDADREREDRAPRVPVGEVPRREGEQRQRDEHREPDEPEIERVPVDLVDLPADRDERHLDRDGRRDRRRDVEREVAVPER